KKGTVVIKAKVGSVKSSCKLSVKNAGVKFVQSTYSTYTDSTIAVKAECKKSLSYKSSDTSIATVSSSGVVTPKAEGTVKITAKSKSGKSASCTVKITKRTISMALSSTTIYKNCHAIITAKGGTTYTYKSSDTKVATVDSSGVITGKSDGKAKITVKSGDASASKNITVKTGSSVHISQTSDSVKKGMTLVLKSSTSGVKWKSSDKSIATVTNGYVLGKKKGTAIISAYTSKGEKDCVVKVKAAEPVRFAYTSENSALLNKTVKFYAITDNKRSDVKFKITDPDKNVSWLTKSTKSNDGSNYIWTASKELSKSGFYNYTAYSRTSSSADWKTCESGEGELFVNKSDSRTACATGDRLVTTDVIEHIASYEGFRSEIEEDNLVANSPTVGYGRVVYSGTTFYNGMTKKEAFAYLVKTINASAYTSRVNAILKDNKIKFNQNHFDALVDFSYNLGAYAITNHSELLETLTSSYGKKSYENTGYINKTSTALRKSADSSSSNLETVKAGTIVTLVSDTVYNSSWYNVKLSDGTKGYIQKGHITMRSSDTSTRNLKNVSVSTYAKNFLAYHHASGTCYKGLLYRRVDELEIFFFNEYDNDGKKNEYGISYKCSGNPSFSL
ncbi:MAG: Ig-like domain-containing protein, partial [Ruminococcus sp.]|nr:Ig-like domain-containing protein [Ruminococcus sp.]